MTDAAAGAVPDDAGADVPGPAPSGSRLTARLLDLVSALRRTGTTIGPGETADAAAVLVTVDLLDRTQLREGLATTLLRRADHRPAFDVLFDLYFPAVLGAGDPTVVAGTSAGAPLNVDAVREQLAALLRADDTAGLAALARGVVDALGRVGAAGQGVRGAAGLPGRSAQQALSVLAPQTLLAPVLAALRAADPEAFADPFTAEVRRREIRERIAAFGRTVTGEVRRRTAEERGPDAVARWAVPSSTGRTEFLTADAEQLARLRRTVAPLARALAARLAARRRRSRRGGLDLRRTARRSLATGGVPLHPAWRARRRTRPELVVLCDVSGSVAGFSHFTLLLVQALREQFSRVRVFAFIERCDEVTDLFAPGTDPAGAVARVLREADLVAVDGHSDYGRAFAGLVDRYPDAVGPRSALLILGDARSNHRDPGLDVLAELVGAARAAHWLNPEPRQHWGGGDSAALRCAEVIPMHECRTLTQLADVVAALLPA